MRMLSFVAIEACSLVACGGTAASNPSKPIPTSDAAADVSGPDAGTASSFAALASGVYTVCAVRAGQVECWGFGGDGELGNGTVMHSGPPTVVSGITTAIGLSPGGQTRCAVLASGDVMCWGDNTAGEIPSAPSGAVTAPVIVSAFRGFSSLSANEYGQICAVSAGGALSCWGKYGTMTIPTPAGATSVAATSSGGCVLLEDGTVACWGANDEGELGNGAADLTLTSVATRVQSLSGVVAIAGGGKFSCALLEGTTVSCWGADNTGQLGRGPLTCPYGGNGNPCSAVPVAVPGLTGVVALTAGDSFACAVLSSGTVWCWGTNVDGELGDGTTTGLSFAPVQVSNLTDVEEIAAGLNHVCARTRSGAVYCWGGDDFGALGSPPTQQCVSPCDATPTQVPL